MLLMSKKINPNVFISKRNKLRLLINKISVDLKAYNKPLSKHVNEYLKTKTVLCLLY